MFLAAPGAVILGSCGPSRPAFTFDVAPGAPPPTRIERLLFWLPPSNFILDDRSVAASFAAALAPYGVTLETGNTKVLELDRSDDQRAVIQRFNPTHRLEIDIVELTAASKGAFSGTSAVLRGILYRRDSKVPLARFDYVWRSKDAPGLAAQVVERLRATGYL
jgi:hypothetical protein